MIWEAFKKAAPELAALGEARFKRSGVILLGTLRKDGFPRITPVEAFIVDGHLCLGMIWQSRKATDLQRDPRCTIHNTITQKDGTEGEFKLYGRAVEISDLEMRKRYCDTLFEETGWKPEEPAFHLFSIDIESAAFNRFEDEAVVARRWLPESGVQVVRCWKADEQA
jgi:hypothetical protein